MRIAVLAATGATGRLLVQQALSRGHTVLALARDPAGIDTSASPHLTAVAADVTDRDSVVRALTDVDAVVSGLGATKGDRPGTLLAGAHALNAARAQRPTLGIVWLGAFGTGQSAGPAGPLVRALLVVALGAERTDKADADTVALAAGASVLHPGPLTDKPLSPTRSTVALADLPRRLFPRTVARATVAAAMLDEAEHPRHRGHIAVPLA